MLPSAADNVENRSVLWWRDQNP